ncbi:MAG: single-stranded DNA-binding protein, partial [Rhodospirillaceae bacterium]|nr:single-stranded DNA-binding protein [Rhodospirillaceae bacterium]
MSRTIHKTDKPVTLEGFQAILAPSKFGYSLAAIVDNTIIDKLETERSDVLKWAESKLKNPKRSTLKPEPWEEVSEGKYKIKFSWNEDNRPPVVDTEGTQVTDTKTPLYAGSTVKLGFYQKPYILRDGVTYGSSL